MTGKRGKTQGSPEMVSVSRMDVQCYQHSSGQASAEILPALQNTQILKKGFKRN